jgi:hypothetical protein
MGIGGGDGGTRRRRTREFAGDGAFCFDKRHGSIFCNATCVSSFFFRKPVSCSRGFSISLRNFMIFFLVGFGFGFVLLCFRERLV